MLRMTKSKAVENQHRVQRHRDRMRAAGLRPIQIWVPDTRAPGFAAEYARQCRIANAHLDPDVDAFVDQLNQDLTSELEASEQSALVGRSPEGREAPDWINRNDPTAHKRS
jgi:hypothetical protein